MLAGSVHHRIYQPPQMHLRDRACMSACVHYKGVAVSHYRQADLSCQPTCSNTTQACNNTPQAYNNIRYSCGPDETGRSQRASGLSEGVERLCLRPTATSAQKCYRLHHQHEKCYPSSRSPLTPSFSSPCSLHLCCFLGPTVEIVNQPAVIVLYILVVVIYGSVHLVVQLRAPLSCCCVISFGSCPVRMVTSRFLYVSRLCWPRVFVLFRSRPPFFMIYRYT